MQLQLYIQTEMRERLVSLPQQVSLREWHHVRVIRLAENITVTLDGELDMQETVILLQPLRTTSPLYIGGLPSMFSIMYFANLTPPPPLSLSYPLSLSLIPSLSLSLIPSLCPNLLLIITACTWIASSLIPSTR